MTEKEYRATRKRICKSIDRWVSCCGLRLWHKVEFVYHRDTAAMANDTSATLSESERFVAGKAMVDWHYQEASIHFNVQIMQNKTDEEIDYIVRHEICHLLVNEMREWEHYDPKTGGAMRHEEHVVTGLAKILNWVWMAGQDEGKKSVRKKK